MQFQTPVLTNIEGKRVKTSYLDYQSGAGAFKPRMLPTVNHAASSSGRVELPAQRASRPTQLTDDQQGQNSTDELSSDLLVDVSDNQRLTNSHNKKRSRERERKPIRPGFKEVKCYNVWEDYLLLKEEKRNIGNPQRIQNLIAKLDRTKNSVETRLRYIKKEFAQSVIDKIFELGRKGQAEASKWSAKKGELVTNIPTRTVRMRDDVRGGIGESIIVRRGPPLSEVQDQMQQMFKVQEKQAKMLANAKVREQYEQYADSDRQNTESQQEENS